MFMLGLPNTFDIENAPGLVFAQEANKPTNMSSFNTPMEALSLELKPITPPALEGFLGTGTDTTGSTSPQTKLETDWLSKLKSFFSEKKDEKGKKEASWASKLGNALVDVGMIINASQKWTKPLSAAGDPNAGANQALQAIRSNAQKREEKETEASLRREQLELEREKMQREVDNQRESRLLKEKEMALASGDRNRAMDIDRELAYLQSKDRNRGFDLTYDIQNRAETRLSDMAPYQQTNLTAQAQQAQAQAEYSRGPQTALSQANQRNVDAEARRRDIEAQQMKQRQDAFNYLHTNSKQYVSLLSALGSNDPIVFRNFMSTPEGIATVQAAIASNPQYADAIAAKFGNIPITTTANGKQIYGSLKDWLEYQKAYAGMEGIQSALGGKTPAPATKRYIRTQYNSITKQRRGLLPDGVTWEIIE